MRAEFTNQAADVAQASAICFQVDNRGEHRVMLVGSLRNGRWGLPKRHVGNDEDTVRAAAREAFEEAGIVGMVSCDVFGTYLYFKDSTGLRYRVTVHLLRVERRLNDFPESGIRRSHWCFIDDAIDLVSQPDLRNILERFRDSISNDPAIGAMNA